jgi:hypothetical protein
MIQRALRVKKENRFLAGASAGFTRSLCGLYQTRHQDGLDLDSEHSEYGTEGFFLFCFINPGSCCATESDLGLSILPPQPPQCWDHRWAYHAQLRVRVDVLTIKT